jgi:putative hydrolase of the HAD superfamily
MIKNIVFDIGGVLADFRIKEFLMEKGLDAPAIKRVLKASVMNPYWGKFERGEVTEEETLQAFAAADPEIEKELRLAFTNLRGMLTVRDYAIPLVKRLKDAGYGVYYLSNYSKKAYDECAESLAFMPYMDGGIVSFKVGMTKPDPRVFQCFLDRFKLQPENCVFIDDTEENVIEARNQGFAGIVFKNCDVLMVELKKLGVETGG